MKIIRGSEIEFVPASHEDPKNPGVLKRVLANKSDLLKGQVQMLNWSQLPVGKSFALHYHEDMQEIFVIINGQVSVTVDGETHELARGDAIIVQPTEQHQMFNACDQNVEYLVFGISTEKGGKTMVVEPK